MGSPTISEQLAKFTHSLSFQDLPGEVIDKAKNRLLDALSTAIAGRDLPVPAVALDCVRRNRGRATIFAHGPRVPAIDAALVNATLINGRSQDDFLLKSHPGALTVPAAMAIAEEEGSSGSEVLTSIVVGFDIIGRIFWGGPSLLPKFRASGVTGTVGAAATAAKLLKLNEEQIKDALGCAAVFSSGFGEGFLTGTMDVKLNVGMSSRNGVMAAILARKGATASTKAFEGESGFYRAFAGTTDRAPTATLDLGQKYLINEVVYKECPACIFVQTPIHLSRSLAEQYNLPTKEIDKVVVRVPEATFTNPGFRNVAPFTSHLQAAVSARFCTAAALLGRPVTSYEFFDEYHDPEVLKLAEKVDLIKEEDGGKVKIEVWLKAGKTYRTEGLEMEMLMPTTEKIKKKFERLAADFLGPKKTARIIDIVLNLDRVKKIRELTDELRP